MIKVTRLDHSELVVNAEMIETIESTPDTVITLTSGKKLVVSEDVEEIVRRVLEYRRHAYGSQQK